MFGVISHVRSPIRTLSQTLIHLPHPFVPSTPVSLIPSNYHPIAYSSLFPLVPTLSSPFSNTPLLQRNENPNATRPPKLLVVQPRLRPETLLRVKLNEALNLANSLEEQRDEFYQTEVSEELPPHLVVQNPALRSLRADTYFGPGTVDTVKCHLNAFESEDERDAIFVNAILTAIQQRNLERAWDKPVLDRVGLIIEIFNAHAQTKEAKLQAELAALMYKKSRLVRVRGPGGRCTFGGTGEAEVVSGRGRGSGGRGFISGAGETELQLQRRRILDRRNKLLSEIKEVRRTWAVQRAARKRHGGAHGQMATVAVVGYTNAGKSTLVSALSNSYLYCDDRLFATVDPKLRSIVLPSGRKVILSDTVGFISDLPVQLVEAFHATLEEVIEADLLVHVLDSSAPNLDEHRETVLQVLEQIGVSEDKLQNMVEVWNKIDLQEEDVGCYGEGEAACHLASDDDDIASDLLSEEHMDENNNNDDKFMTELASEEAEGIIDDQQGDYSDGWLSSEDGQGIQDVHDNSSVGWETPDDERRTSKNRRIAGRRSYSGEESIPHVKTSAVTGIGLQELLELLDDRLKTFQIQKQDMFDRKWRPPRAEDTGLAVEE